MIVIVDSDGLIGTTHPEDMHYLESTKFLKRLLYQNAKLIYPSTTIAEATAVLQIRLNSPEIALKIMDLTKNGNFKIEAITEEILISAISFINPTTNKHATIFDGVVAAVAQKYQADAIFSFDKFYKSKGFKLASDLKP